MKKIFALLGSFIILLAGCSTQEKNVDIAATTLPVYEFTSLLCQNTGLTVGQLVTENVSCLHDYALNVRQVKTVESADHVVISGAGLEEFMEDLLDGKSVIDASTGIELLEGCHEHEHGHAHEDDHGHEEDSHIWLSASNAMIMAENIFDGLVETYPEHEEVFQENFVELQAKIQSVIDYGKQELSQLNSTEIITFHDGFSYFAEEYGITILEAIEEESGSEASAAELKHIIGLVKKHDLTTIFVEKNGSGSAASIIATETGAIVFTLDMAMSGSWFDSMYHNIDTIKEALG